MKNQTDRPWIIYTLTDPRTKQIRYVGVTFRSKRRFNEHMSHAITGGNTYLDRWIRSLVAEGIRPIYQTIQHGHGLGWQEAEQQWITHYRQSTALVNCTNGGEGCPGYVPTPELRQKWSTMRRGVPYAPDRKRGMLGKHHTPEAREKIRKAGLGRQQSEHVKQAVSKAQKGKKHTNAHRAKHAAAMRGKKLTSLHKAKIAATTTNRKPVLCVETGEVFPSMTAAAKAVGTIKDNIMQAVRKGCRSRGYHWRPLK